MDGHFVPNISFGTPVIASLRKRSRMFFDAHLMIADPMRYAEPFVKAGCDHLTFHAEAVEAPERVIEHVRSLGVSVGVSLNPTTPVESIEAIVDNVDMVLVMSVWPGFGGQTFIADVLPKVEILRERLASHQRLEIDGGIDVDTVAEAARAGADVLVAGSAVFGKPDPVGAMKELHRFAQDAVKAGGGRVEPHAAKPSGD
jgi:ribulose-phosphate 3-epimerase